MKILRRLKRIHTDIVLLQETHLKDEEFKRMQKLWVGNVLCSGAVDRKAGVMILVHKNMVQ